MVVEDDGALPVEDRLERLLLRFEAAMDRFERKISEDPQDDDTDEGN